ncbi:MAG: ammonia-forming cytochrome c nitrite reductase subunit c552 [Eggerthellaceae bacterium]|nr:ammonia-forming cytochrome c nitrite reductase subunit c552 [Eggerthellaceae bacterium]
MKKKLIVGFVVMACALCLGVAFGCAPAQNQASSASASADAAASAETSAVASDEAATSAEAVASSAAASQAAAPATGEMLSLAEYAEKYPLQTSSWLQKREDGGKCMATMEENFRATLGAAFGMDGIPLYCGSCHNANYKQLLAEVGDENMLVTDAHYDGIIEYMGCGVCHSADLEAGVDDNTSFWPTFISEESWNKYINQDDAVCGQCHMLEPSSAYMLPEFRGTVDIYKYGIDADSVYKAMMEAWEENPIEITQVMVDNGFHVGATRIDEETGALIIGDNNKPILETYQGSNHQNMGLTCIDCHMVEATAEDGTTYTDHFACDPLNNETALENCLTCHKAQGQDSTEAMREFVLGKQEELAKAQQALEANLATFKDELAQANVNSAFDADALKTAQEAYTKAVFYTQFQAQLTSDKKNQGATAAHNPTETYANIEKAEAAITEGMAALGQEGSAQAA